MREAVAFLYTRGGDTSTARNIVNLLRMYGDNLQIIVLHKSHSAGKIISLGANEIVMTKQATLGPIDPSLYTPLNPRRPDGGLFFNRRVCDKGKNVGWPDGNTEQYKF